MDSFLRKVYFYRFFDGLNLISGIFALFFASRNLTPFQISVLIAIWSITSLLLEVPLGAVADKYPRKYLLIAAQILGAAGLALWFIDSFFFYALGFALWGAKNALQSGTIEAFLYDELKEYDKEDYYQAAFGKSGSYYWIGVMLSAVIGGFIAQISGFYLVIGLGITTRILSGLIISTAKPVKPQKSTGESKYFQILKQAVKEIRTSRKLLLVLIFIILTFPIYGSAEEFFNLLFESYEIDIWIIGLMMGLVYGIIAVASYSLTFLDKFKIKNLEYWLLMGSGVLFFAVGLVKSIFILPLFFLAIYLLSVSGVAYDVKFQHAIKSSERATISSLKSFCWEIFYLIFLLVFGFISDKFGLNSVIIVMGGLTVLITILLGSRLKKAFF